MKTYLLNILPKIQKFSHKLDNIELLTNQHWVLMGSIGSNKTIYIFRKNKELIVSTNGKATKGKWDYLGNNSVLIDILEKSYLFKHGFFDTNALAMKIDNTEEYAVFINENRFEGELNSIEKLEEFLKEEYLDIKMSSQGSNTSKTNKAKSISKSIQKNNEESKRILVGVLAILFGWLGIHKFILGYTIAGFIQLILTFVSCGLLAIIPLIEGVIYLTKTNEEFINTYQINKKQWF